ncbi:MAG: hypothetical protein ACE37F_13125 [Nannocystaceae bacterium]|nr:hypothetical protein [bacterium]
MSNPRTLNRIERQLNACHTYVKTKLTLAKADPYGPHWELDQLERQLGAIYDSFIGVPVNATLQRVSAGMRLRVSLLCVPFEDLQGNLVFMDSGWARGVYDADKLRSSLTAVQPGRWRWPKEELRRRVQLSKVCSYPPARDELAVFKTQQLLEAAAQ